MFEILVTLCLNASQSICHEIILPLQSSIASMDICGILKPDQIRNWQSTLSKDVFLKSSKCVPRPKSNLLYNEIAKGVYVHMGAIDLPRPQNRGDIANIGFIIGEKSVAVIDPGGSYEIGVEQFLAIRNITDLPISHIIITHMHPDHIYGAAPFEAIGAKIIGHKNLAQGLKDRAESYRENYLHQLDPFSLALSTLPSTLTAPSQIDLGNRILNINQFPTAHSDNDVTVYDELTKTLFAGDLLFHDHVPVLDGSLKGWQKAITDNLNITSAHIIPGHGAIDANEATWNAELEYLNLLASDAKNAIANGARLQDAQGNIGQSAKENWKLFDEYNPRNATVAFTELEWE